MKMSCTSFLRYLRHDGVWEQKFFIVNSDCMIILPIVCVENTVENVYWIFRKTAGQSYLVKIGLVMHNKCLQTDIAHNSVNRSPAE